MSDLEGRIIRDRYSLRSRVGEGGFAIVYRADDQVLNRQVAIKILKQSQDRESAARFLQEAKLLGSLSHKNIVSVYSFDLLDDTTPFMVMEFLEGRSLQRLILENIELSYEQLCSLIRQCCLGLGYLHDAGVLHRDVSPANIFLTGDLNEPGVKLLDFGLSKIYEAGYESRKFHTATGLIVGNPFYMSPESAAGKRADRRSDIYSFGSVLYEIFTGNSLFQADNAIGILFKQMNEEPPEPTLRRAFSSFTREEQETLKYIILRCLRKDPDQRFQSCQEILHVLDKGSEEGAPGYKWSVPSHSAKKTPYLYYLTAAIFGSILLATLLSLRSSKQELAGKPQIKSSSIKKSYVHPLMRLEQINKSPLRSTQQLESEISEINSFIPGFKARSDNTKLFLAYMILGDRFRICDGNSLNEKQARLNALACCKLPDGRLSTEAAQCYRDLARIAFLKKHFDEAQVNALKALSIFQRAAETEEYPTLPLPSFLNIRELNNVPYDSCMMLAQSFLLDNNLNKAKKYAELAAEYRKQYHFGFGAEPEALICLADILWLQGAKEQATHLLPKFQAEFYQEKPGPTPSQDEVQIMITLGRWYDLHGSVRKASELLAAAKKLNEQTKDKRQRESLARTIEAAIAVLGKRSQPASVADLLANEYRPW